MKLKKLNWEPFLYERLCSEIENNKNNDAYMVFDFDETIVTGDVEEHIMFFMAKNFLYKMNVSEFSHVLKSNLNTDENINNIADDLIFLYEKLSKSFVKGSEIHETFIAKLIYFYYNVYSSTKLEKGKVYPTYLFYGYTQDEFDIVCKDMIEEFASSDIKYFNYETRKGFEGKSGKISSTFYKNPSFNTEIIDLFKVAKENGIVTNIISASPFCIIKGIVESGPLEMNEKSMLFGMPHLYDEDKIISTISKDKILSVREGKTEIIKNFIMPKYNNDPLAIFGDSMGDYSMLTHFEDTKLSVLFDRNLDDETKIIKSKAIEQYRDSKARYLLQGKDYTISEFIPFTKSILE